MKKKIVYLLFIVIACLSFTACEKVEFSINFMVDDTVYSTINTNGNETIKMPSDPTKEGFTFKGWFWDKDSLAFAFYSKFTA